MLLHRCIATRFIFAKLSGYVMVQSP